METEKKQEEPKKDRRRIIIFLLLISNCIVLWMYWTERNRANEITVVKEQVIVERDNVKLDLVHLQEEYSTLQTNDEALQEEINEKKEQIAILIKEAEKHKNDSYIIAKLKKETETLRKIMKGYIVTIDSLNTLNQTLIVEKNQVKEQLSTEKTKTSKLSKEKEELQGVIQKGAILKASGITAFGVRFKSGGTKELTTEKASKVEKIKVSFTLAENKMAKNGDRNVFIRVITPEGKELALSSDDMFKFGGSKGFYAGKETINYNNEETSMSMYCEGSKESFVPGKYIIEIYSDAANIGQTTLTLK